MNSKHIIVLVVFALMFLGMIASFCAINHVYARELEEECITTSSDDTVTETVEIEIVEEIIEEEIIQGIFEEVPDVPRDFKTYTDYTKLSKKYPQWTKVQTIAYTDENGLRKVDNYYCVAMGSYYTNTVGDLFRITTETGNVFEVIITDFKADRDTDTKNQYTTLNYCIVEFYVDIASLPSKARRCGTISKIKGFDGKVISIERLGNYFEV